MKLYYCVINSVFCLIFAEDRKLAFENFNSNGIYVDYRDVNEFNDSLSWFIENAIKRS